MSDVGHIKGEPKLIIIGFECKRVSINGLKDGSWFLNVGFDFNYGTRLIIYIMIFKIN